MNYDFRLVHFFKQTKIFLPDANVKLSGSNVQELRDCLQELVEDMARSPTLAGGSASEFNELSEPDQADRPDLFSNGVAPVLPSMSLG